MKAKDAKRQFLEYIEIERGQAVKTVENYDHYLTRYFAQMKIKDVGDISEQNIRDFRLWLNRQSGSAERTGNVGSGTMKRYTRSATPLSTRRRYTRTSPIPTSATFTNAFTARTAAKSLSFYISPTVRR